jgi:penicillin-binding protein 2
MRDASGNVRWLAPIEGQRITNIADTDWTVITNAMIGTTRCAQYCGTGWVAFKGSAYPVAGKTGTAQVYSVAQDAKYNAKTLLERLRDHAWFIAFAPADAPRIAVAVLVENAGFGSMSAAPVARKVIDAYLLDADGKLKPAPPGSNVTPQSQGPTPDLKTASGPPVSIDKAPDEKVMSAQARDAAAEKSESTD